MVNEDYRQGVARARHDYMLRHAILEYERNHVFSPTTTTLTLIHLEQIFMRKGYTPGYSSRVAKKYCQARRADIKRDLWKQRFTG